MKLMLKILPLIFILTLIFFTVLNFPALKREIYYKLNLDQDPTAGCCNVTDILSSDGNFDENANIAIFQNEIIDYPKTSLVYNSQPPKFNPNVLGTSNGSGEEKWIEVSLEQQRLRAFEGNRMVIEFPISSGKWAPTPKGTFNIWYKTRNQTMQGGSKALGTYYNLPNVPHNMFFYQGYAVHGAYWHNNFGQPMSHGCVNSPLANVAELFEWTGPVVPEGQNVARASADNPGTRVWVH